MWKEVEFWTYKISQWEMKRDLNSDFLRSPYVSYFSVLWVHPRWPWCICSKLLSEGGSCWGWSSGWNSCLEKWKRFKVTLIPSHPISSHTRMWKFPNLQTMKLHFLRWHNGWKIYFSRWQISPVHLNFHFQKASFVCFAFRKKSYSQPAQN